jgi:peptidoglycan/xylan/chitin deacetylase (PgdA/CDA1 family)
MLKNKKASKNVWGKRLTTIVFIMLIIMSSRFTELSNMSDNNKNIENGQASIHNQQLNIDEKLPNKSNATIKKINNEEGQLEVRAKAGNPVYKVMTEKYESTREINKNSFDASKIQDLLTKHIKIEDGKKIAFLTFDDGPSTTVTPEVLRVLKDNNIKATFFVIGKQVEDTPEAKRILQDIYNEGHAIGNHTYSHNYSKLFPRGRADANAFMAEVEKTDQILKSVLGQDFNTDIVRFPGGHCSWKGTEELDKRLAEKNYKYIDWNALVGDAEGGPKTREQLIKRYHQTFVGQQQVVLLMHDTYGKKSTAEALQYIITDLKNKGYEFKTIS